MTLRCLYPLVAEDLDPVTLPQAFMDSEVEDTSDFDEPEEDPELGEVWGSEEAEFDESDGDEPLALDDDEMEMDNDEVSEDLEFDDEDVADTDWEEVDDEDDLDDEDLEID